MKEKRFWTLLIRREGRFHPEFGSFVRGEAIAKMSELQLKRIRRSDPDLNAAVVAENRHVPAADE